METPQSVRSFLRNGEWITSIDFTDAYPHVPIHLQSRKLSLNFLSVFKPSSQASHSPSSGHLISEGGKNNGSPTGHTSALIPGDDWLIRAPSQAQALPNTKRLLALAHNLGFIVNTKKSGLTPTQRFDFIDTI